MHPVLLSMSPCTVPREQFEESRFASFRLEVAQQLFSFGRWAVVVWEFHSQLKDTECKGWGDL